MLKMNTESLHHSLTAMRRAEEPEIWEGWKRNMAEGRE
jgi:hypothetical protein